jgi:exodeoxyribonuclease-5
MDLSPDQSLVLEQLYAWTKNRTSLLTLGGFAGTGKTTVLSYFAAQQKKLAAYVTFTGRAHSVLRRKLVAAGVKTTDLQHVEGRRSQYGTNHGGRQSGPPFSGTIHKLVYRAQINSQDELLGFDGREQLDRDYSFLVVDEASMVSDQILQDLKRFDTPILAVGDHGQLAPVMGSGALMQSPMLRLETIHRQAAGSPIIQLADRVRRYGSLSAAFEMNLQGAVRFRKKADILRVLQEAYAERSPMDVAVICWTNRVRVRLNAIAREALGYSGLPREGEVVMSLKNDPPVMNGIRGICMSDAQEGAFPWIWEVDIAYPEEDIPSERYDVCAKQFGRYETFRSIEELNRAGVDVYRMGEAGKPVDFGYAMTAHRSQGSQWPHVIVYMDRSEDPASEDFRRWIYTSVTRASEKLTIVV